MTNERMQFAHQRKIDVGERWCQMRWNVRGEHGQTESHAVASASVAERYCSSIQGSAQQLTQELGWRWSERHPAVINVDVNDAGPGVAGYATIDLHNVPYLLLSCRRFSSDDEMESQRLGNLVLHELVHLLQFGADVWWSWPTCGLIGEHDPNNWLHEGVALATEAIYGEGTADWYPWLWKWAVAPHESLETDESGTRAAPFLIYLAEKLGPKFLANVYSAENIADAPRQGSELLDSTIHRHASAKSLSTMFMEYCAAWMSAERLWSSQAHSIRRIVGDRAISEVISASTISAHSWKSRDWVLRHLACRYFTIHDLASVVYRKCEISVVVEELNSAAKLTGTAMLLSKEGTLQQEIHLGQSSIGLHASVSYADNVGDLRIVVVNTAFGSEWALHDDIHFRVVCSWSH